MNRLIVVRLLLMLVMLVSGFGLADAPSRAQDDEFVYEDPQGRFTVPVPSTWSVVEHDDYVSLVDPEGDASIALVVVPAPDAREGITAAWVIVDPDFAAQPLPGMDQDIPSDVGIDETVLLTYDIGQTTGMVTQALAQRVGEAVHAFIFRGSLDAAVRRDAQIQVIATGWKITG